MVSLSRLSALSVLGLTLSVIGTSGAQASTAATCESVAADPPSINLYKDLPDFREVVARLARDCPGVLTALDVPLSTILRTPVVNPFGSDRATTFDTPPSPPSPPQAIPRNLLADITAAQKDLDQATVAVLIAGQAVQDAVGQVKALARITRAELVKKGWTLADLTEKRSEALGELLFAQLDLLEAQANLTIAISDAEEALQEAQQAQTAAKGKLDTAVQAAKKPIAELDAHLGKVDEAKGAITTLETTRKGLLTAQEQDKSMLTELARQLESQEKNFEELDTRCINSECSDAEKDQLDAIGKLVKDTKFSLDVLTDKMLTEDREITSLTEKITTQTAALATLNAETQSLTAKANAAKEPLAGLEETEKAAAEAVKLAEQKGKDDVERAKSAEKDAIENLTEKLENAKALATLSRKEEVRIAEVADLKEDLDQAIGTLILEQKQAKHLLTEVPGDAPEDVKKAASVLQLSMGSTASGIETSMDVSNSVYRAILEIDASITDLNKAIARIEDPIDESDDPIDESDGPIDESDGPIDESDDPIDESDGPIDESDGPIDESDGPTEQADDPTQQADDPTQQTDAPIAQTDAPVDPSNGES